MSPYGTTPLLNCRRVDRLPPNRSRPSEPRADRRRADRLPERPNLSDEPAEGLLREGARAIAERPLTVHREEWLFPDRRHSGRLFADQASIDSLASDSRL